MNIETYVNQNVLILIPFLYMIGMFLKSSAVKDKYIPIIILIIALIVCPIILKQLDLNSIIQSVLLAGTTVFTNQLIKQTTN